MHKPIISKGGCKEQIESDSDREDGMWRTGLGIPRTRMAIMNDLEMWGSRQTNYDKCAESGSFDDSDQTLANTCTHKLTT